MDAGISNALHRLQLINRRDELVLAEREKQANSGFIPAGGTVNRSSPSVAGPAWGRQNSGLQVRLALSFATAGSLCSSSV